MSCKIEEMPWREIISECELALKDKEDIFNIIKNINWKNKKELDEVVEQFLEGEISKDDLAEYFEAHSDNLDKIKFFMLSNSNRAIYMEETYGGEELEKIEKPKLSDMNKETQRKAMGYNNSLLRFGNGVSLLRDAYDCGERRGIIYIPSEVTPEILSMVPIKFMTRLSSKEADEYQEQQHKMETMVLEKSDISIQDMMYQNPNGVLWGMELDETTKKGIEYYAASKIAGEKEELSHEEVLDLETKYKEQYVEQLTRVFKMNMPLLNVGDFMINVVKANVYAVDNYDMEPDEREIAIKRLEQIFSLASRVLQKGVSDDKDRIQEFKDLKEQYKKRQVNGKYVTKDNINEVIEDLKSGKYSLRTLDKVVLDMMEEIPGAIILLNEDNFNYAVKNNLLNERSLYELIAENKNCNTKILIYALNKGMLTKNDIIELYMQKNIGIEQIREIEESEGQLITLDDVVQKYNDDYEVVHEPEYYKQPDYVSFEELAEQARALQEPGFESEKVEESLFELDSQNLEVALIEFYKNFLVGAKQVLESCGSNCIRVLRPVDIRNLYLNNDITLEDIQKNISSIDEERAIHLICQIFPGRGYSDELNELIQSLSVEHEERKGNGEGHERHERNKTKTKGKIDVLATTYKYGFYESLDPECEVNYLPKSGYVIFTLPNVKYRGTEEPSVVVEPMFDKSHNTQQVVAAQDKAMWILPMSLWREEKANIVNSGGRLNIEKLREVYSLNKDKNKMTKMHHTVETKEKIADKKQQISEGKIPKTGWPFRVFNFARESKKYSDEEISGSLDLALSLEESMVRE